MFNYITVCKKPNILSGGIVTILGTDYIHLFKNNTNLGIPQAISPYIKYLIVGGGGGGGGRGVGGGGGGGGVLSGTIQLSSNQTVVIGSGGKGYDGAFASNGYPSYIGSLVLVSGGGYGGSYNTIPAAVGGAGGGGFGGALGGSGIPGQGFAGGNGYFAGNPFGGGGGGGAGKQGIDAIPTGTACKAGDGGSGIYSNILGSGGYFGGGGGGGGYAPFANSPGIGGLGNTGGLGGYASTEAGYPGSGYGAGGGGGAGGGNALGGIGSSGVLILRYIPLKS